MTYSRYPPTLLLACLEGLDDECEHIFCNSVLILLITTDLLLSRLIFDDNLDLLFALYNASDDLFCCRCSDSSSISLITDWADLEEGEIRLCSALMLEPPPPPN